MLLLSVFIPSVGYLIVDKYVQAQPFYQDARSPSTSVSSLPAHSQTLLGLMPDCWQHQVLDLLPSHLWCGVFRQSELVPVHRILPAMAAVIGLHATVWGRADACMQ